ncbi:MAG: nuclear transport factor 2 family protein [Pseudomonadota bacterium]
MIDPNENLDRMLAVWNSADPAERQALTDQALEHNVHFVDPNHNIVGRAAFLTMVQAVQAQIPGATFRRASAVDMQNNFCRYHWAVHLNDELIMAGSDVTEVNDAGKIVKVIGFFGPLERVSETT